MEINKRDNKVILPMRLFSLGVALIISLILGFSIIASSSLDITSLAAQNTPRGKAKIRTTPTPTPTPKLLQPVTVLIPNGGESYTVGGTMTIKWQVNDITQYNQANSSIWLASRSTQSDGTYVYQNQVPIAKNPIMQPGENTFTWTIPASWSYVSFTGETITITVGGGSYVVLVNLNNSAPNYDYSDQPFTILNSAVTPTPTPTLSPSTTPTVSACSNTSGTVAVLTPNGGESYKLGDTLTIKWCVNDFTQYTQTNSYIWLSTRETQASGSYVYRNQVQIASNVYMTAGENSLNWTIPATLPIGYNYVILLGINSFYPNYDFSNGIFAILSP